MKNKKPKNVPLDAFFNDQALWEICTFDAKGRRQGESKCWSKSGVLLFKKNYKDGLYDGSSKFYLPNGNLNEESFYTRGMYQQGTFFVNKKYNTNVRPDSSADVVKWKMLADPPNCICRFVFYNKDGKEIDRLGNPMPKRPKKLPSNTDYFPAERDCPWIQATLKYPNYKRFGIWKRWSLDGELVRVEQYSDEGKLIILKKYEYGELRDEIHYDPETEQITSEKSFVHNELFFQTNYLYNESTLSGRQDFSFEKRKKIKWGEGKLDLKSKKMVYSLFSSSKKEEKLAFGNIEGKQLKGVWKVIDPKNLRWLTVDILNNYFDITNHNVIESLRWIYYENELKLQLKKKLDLPESLKKANEFSWKNMQAAFGKHTLYFPKLLAIVASGEPLEVVARGNIFYECNHQDTLYEVTGRIIPFYIELLKNKKVNREGILEDLNLFSFFTTKEINEILSDRSIKKESPLWFSSVGVLKAFVEGIPVLKEVAANENNKLSLLAENLLRFTNRINKKKLK